MSKRRCRPRFSFISVLALSAFAALVSPLLAQDPDPGGWCGAATYPGDPPPGSHPFCRCQEECTGSPCYVASGNLVQSEADLQIRTAGFPLQVARSYDSGRVVDGPTGYGWTSNLVARLYYATYLFQAPSTYLKEAVIIMPDGQQLTFTENPDGVTYTPPFDRHDVLLRNQDGSYTMTLDRSRSVYAFDPFGALISMTDDYGNALSFTYTSGRLSRVADTAGSGGYIDVSWGADGRISIVQDSSGRQVQYFYNTQGAAQGALASIIEPASRTTSYGYVSGRFSPLLSSIADTWGRTVLTVTYFSPSDKVQTYTDRGETYTFIYNYQNTPTRTAKTDSLGNIWTYNFGPLGKITDRGLQGGPRSYTTYNADGSILSTQDQVGVVTLYGAYNPNGAVSSITRDSGGPTAVRFDYTYDPNFPEKVASITPKVPSTAVVDPNWQAWRYDYWLTGSPAPGALNHVYRVQSDGSTLDTLSTSEYDSHGRVTRVTSATGGVTDYAYDASGNLQTVTGPANNDAGARPVTTYGYDPLGRVTSVTDPLNHATSYTYDGLDRVATVALPKPSPSSTLNFLTTYSYDNFDSGAGLVFTNITDPNGRITKQGYDQYAQLVKSTDAANNSTTYTFPRGLLASVTDANANVTSYGYDSTRRLISTTFPDSAIEQYTYYGDNLLYQKTDRKSQTITFSYDHQKRVSQRTYPGSTSVTSTYLGQKLTQVVDTTTSPTETHTFAYDPSYRLQSDTQATRGTITRTYNADDSIAAMTVQGGPTAGYSYYSDGSLNTIGWSPVSGNFKYTYSLASQYQGITFPNAQSRNFAYDDQGRLTQLSNLDPAAGNLATYAYGYDLNYTTGQNTMLGQRVSMTATVPSQGLSNHTATYEYDPNYQLLKATYPNTAPFNGEIDSWTYDAIGNRLTNTVNGSPQTYTYQKIGSNPNNWQRLTNDSSNAYTYDGNGSTLTRNGPSGNVTFGWNTDNRLISISGAATASYVYDYQGRRSKKTVGSATTYLYDGLNLVQETSASSADYLFGPGIDEPLAMSRGGQVYYYETDALGSINAITNSSGTVQNTYLYDSWGQVKSQTGTLANSFTYTARETGDAGLSFYRARYYQTAIGRFLQEDPNGYEDGPNLYGYVNASPITQTDPFGLAGVGGPITIPLPGEGVGQGAGAGAAAAAIAWCISNPECRGRVKCVANYFGDQTRCIWCGICPDGDPVRWLVCMAHAQTNLRKCWTSGGRFRPYPNPCPAKAPPGPPKPPIDPGMGPIEPIPGLTPPKIPPIGPPQLF
jgi:RHS repeat-associated protein